METKYQQMEESEIIQSAQSGDGDAMAFLLENYKGMVRALARPLFLMDGDFDDLIQEGMIGLYKAIQTYHPEKGTAFKTFANLCISSQLYSAIKHSNRQKNKPLNTYISLDTTDKCEDNNETDRNFTIDKSIELWQKSPEEIVIGRENAKNTKYGLFSRLSKMEKRVLELFLKGMTYQEIAVQLDKSPKAIDNALQRIKSKLMKLKKWNFKKVK